MTKTLFVGCVLSLFLGITAPSYSTDPITTGSATNAQISYTDVSAPPRRVALIIGNAGYKQQPLRTPRADARSVGRLLSTMGFEVLTLENATRLRIHEALEEFDQRRRESDVALFYYAGHAVQMDGTAYLLPVDTQTESPTFLRGIDIRDIVTEMSSGRHDQARLILVDACLNNPFQSSVTSADQLALTRLPAQTLLAFGTSPGGIAFDGAGAHGLFTEEILRLLPKAGMTLDEIFSRIQLAVGQRSDGGQTPWFVSSLHNPYYLHPESTDTVTEPLHPQTLVASAPSQLGLPRGLLPQDGEARIELEFWKSIEDSTDASDYEAYLKAYPKGRFAPLAKARADRYQKSAPPPKQAEPTVEDMDIDYVAVTDANLRQAPSAQAQLAGRLAKNSSVHVTGRVTDGKWYRIKTASGDTAYVYADLLTRPAAPTPFAPARTTPAAPPISATPPPKAKALVAASPPTPTAVAVKSTEAIQDCPTCPAMIVIPAGRFIMGDNNGDRSERPAHSVTIARPFAISKNEITTGQWKECVAASHCSFQAETSGTDADTPVRDISWNDAQQYVRWLSQATKQAYRLPTEAEWEYAARAGTPTRFWWGDKIGTGHANCKNCGGPWDRATPGVATAFPPNPFGLYGMNGGVWEWVSDCWNNSHEGAPADGRSRDQPDCREHVIRGGSWRDDATYVHSASRFKYDTNVRYLMNGFRIAKTLP